MLDLHPQYLTRLSARRERLIALLPSIEALHREAVIEALQLARALRGSAGTYGLARLTLAAAAVLELPPGPGIRQRVEMLVQALGEAVAARSDQIKLVLLVDQDADLTEALKLELAAPLREVLVAATAQAAQDLMAARHVHAMLVSVQLPDRRGPEVLAALRGNRGRGDLHLAATGTEPAARVRDACVAAGAETYFEKPWGLDTVVRWLQPRSGGDAVKPAVNLDPVTQPIGDPWASGVHGSWRSLSPADLTSPGAARVSTPAPPRAPTPATGLPRVGLPTPGHGLPRVGMPTPADGLPRVSPAAPPPAVRVAPPPQPAAPDPAAARRVLVADQDAATVAQIVRQLQADGFEVLTAKDGWQAFSVAQPRQLGGIVLDIDLPVMDGLHFVTRLRTLASHRHTPVMLVASREREGDLMKAFQAGADDWMTKPLVLADLSARLRHLADTAARRAARLHAQAKT